MFKKISFSALLIFLLATAYTQQSLPLIKAKNVLVDIKDGNNFMKGYWTITPSAHPDVYTTSVKEGSKKITFYTDVDSVSFNVTPNSFTAFNILLNNKDTAFTGIYAFDTLATLKKAGAYNISEKSDMPLFTYQDSNNVHLRQLRTSLKLDSIAGQGNEVSRILNLLHWMHNLIPHDGNHENPEVKNAMSMIAECKKDNRGLNCRGLATALNECYLSMGYKSRFVTCLPKDSLHIDNDCHVIDMVYSNDLKKWLWIDPTFDAYVMNEKGELLGIEEVRERIINDQPLILNPEANWNHKASETKDYYLYSYMAKNLYMLECAVSSEYDTETRQPGKTITYVELIPLDYYRKSLDKSISTNNISKTTSVTYRTNNPKSFWEAPL